MTAGSPAFGAIKKATEQAIANKRKQENLGQTQYATAQRLFAETLLEPESVASAAIAGSAMM